MLGLVAPQSAKADVGGICGHSQPDWVVISPTPRPVGMDVDGLEYSVMVRPLDWVGSWPTGLVGPWGWRIPVHTCVEPLHAQPVPAADCPQGWMAVRVHKDDLKLRLNKAQQEDPRFALGTDYTAVQVCGAYLGRVKHLEYATLRLNQSCYGPVPNWMNVGWYFVREDVYKAKMYDHVATVPSTVTNGYRTDWVGYKEIQKPVYGTAHKAVYGTRCPYAGVGYVPGWAGNPHAMYGTMAGLPNQVAQYEVKVDIGFKGRFQKYANYYNVYYPGFDRGLFYTPPVVHRSEKQMGDATIRVVETPTNVTAPPMGAQADELYYGYGYGTGVGNFKVAHTSGLTVRNKPSVNGKAIGALKAGDTVSAHGAGVDGPGCQGGAWLRVYHHKGNGYVCSVFLKPLGEAAPLTYPAYPHQGGMAPPPEPGMLYGYPSGWNFPGSFGYPGAGYPYTGPKMNTLPEDATQKVAREYAAMADEQKKTD